MRGAFASDCRKVSTMKSEKGFTLIELLTVVAIIGILAALGLSSFSVYRASAAYAVVQSTIHSARNASEVSFNNTDSTPGSVPLTTQTSPGSISDNAAKAVLPGMQLPRNVKFQVAYDPTCEDSTCQAEFIQVSHCFSSEHGQWIRFGDGVDVLLDHVAGGGCS